MEATLLDESTHNGVVSQITVTSPRQAKKQKALAWYIVVSYQVPLH